MNDQTVNEKSRGFTLVEILVTVAIIVLILSITVISYRSVAQRSRDAKRKADLQVISGALERYYADKGCYPPCPYYDPRAPGGHGIVSIERSFTNDWVNSAGYNEEHPLGALIDDGYLSVLPYDPVNEYVTDNQDACGHERVYQYWSEVGQNPQYVLSAVEEEKGSSGCTVECSPSYFQYQYCVSSQ